MELVCGNNNASIDDQSNDSVGDNDINHSGVDAKGSLRYEYSRLAEIINFICLSYYHHFLRLYLYASINSIYPQNLKKKKFTLLEYVHSHTLSCTILYILLGVKSLTLLYLIRS